MKQQLLVGFVAAFLVVPAFADKPEWADEGKPVVSQKEVHREAMQAKDEYKLDGVGSGKLKQEKNAKQEKLAKEKKLKDDLDELSGLEKQKVKKAEQQQKELGRGSETGQDAREVSKKWWKFWE